jgi:hypothetical protein
MGTPGPDQAGPASDVTCELWIDGVRAADTPAEALTEPTALARLQIAWGRDNAEGQPEPSTCAFTVTSPGDSTAATALLAAGKHADVWAQGRAIIPVQANQMDDSTMESWPLHAASVVPFGHVVPVHTSGQVAQLPAALEGGVPFGRAVGVTVTALTTETAGALILPRPIDGDWTTMPSCADSGGIGTWNAYVWVWIPQSISVYVRLAAYNPVTNTFTPNDVMGFATVGRNEWRLVGQPGNLPPIPGTYPVIYLEMQTPAATTVTWATATGAWNVQTTNWNTVPLAPQVGQLMWADTAQIYNTENTVASRRTRVFSGRITDVVTYMDPVDPNRVYADATAVDVMAEYAHRYVGDEPWLKETAQARANRICAAAAPPITPAPTWPAAYASEQVTYRDVDNQSSTDLLRALADSFGCVMWLKTTGTTDSILIEDPATREPLLTLVMDGQSGKIVVRQAANTPLLVNVSACELLADPVRISQDTDTIVSIVDVTWNEQGTDSEGQPEITERSVKATDATALANYGSRRLGVGTELTTAAQAGVVADRTLAHLRIAPWFVENVTWHTLDGGDSNEALLLLGADSRIAAPVAISELPAWSPIGEALVTWCEGGTLEFDGTWILALTLTPAALGSGAISWGEIPPGWPNTGTTWNWYQFHVNVDWRNLWAVGSATT